MAKLSSSKLYYSISEVCSITKIRPHVLRYWESEFKELSPQKNRAGNRVYKKSDIQTIFKIKHLLYDERYTIEGAKIQLSSGDGNDEAMKILEIKTIVSEIRNDLKKLAKILS